MRSFVHVVGVFTVIAIGGFVARLTTGSTNRSRLTRRRLNTMVARQEPGSTDSALRRWSERLVLWRRHRATILSDELAGSVEAIAGLLRTGLSLPVALDVATRGAMGKVPASLAHAVSSSRHLGLAGALDVWVARLGTEHPQVPVVARALLIVSHGGPGAATALDGLAEGLRATTAVEREVQALSSQARLSGTVMAIVPLGFAALLSGTDANARAFLFGSRIGVACLATGLLLDAAAWWWMRRLAVVKW